LCCSVVYILKWELYHWHCGPVSIISIFLFFKSSSSVDSKSFFFRVLHDLNHFFDFSLYPHIILSPSLFDLLSNILIGPQTLSLHQIVLLLLTFCHWNHTRVCMRAICSACTRSHISPRVSLREECHAGIGKGRR
jgi:hypothetical protein